RALRRDPPRVGQQRHLTGDLDRAGDLPLLLHVVAADTAVADLGAVAHEAGEQVDVLVVDVHHPLGDERAGLLLVLARGGVLGLPGAVLLAGHRCVAFVRCSERLFVAVDRIGGATTTTAAGGDGGAAVGRAARGLLD